MANSAHKIAGPIIDEAFKKSEVDLAKKFLGKPALPTDFKDYAAQMVDYRQLGGRIRMALNGAGRFHPAVIEGWAHEPRRRALLAKNRIERRAERNKVRKAREKRREQKKHAKKKAHRTMQKIGRAVKNFAARAIFRGGLKGQ